MSTYRDARARTERHFWALQAPQSNEAFQERLFQTLASLRDELKAARAEGLTAADDVRLAQETGFLRTMEEQERHLAAIIPSSQFEAHTIQRNDAGGKARSQFVASSAPARLPARAAGTIEANWSIVHVPRHEAVRMVRKYRDLVRKAAENGTQQDGA